jgi:hypothetical protein
MLPRNAASRVKVITRGGDGSGVGVKVREQPNPVHGQFLLLLEVCYKVTFTPQQTISLISSRSL